MTILLLGAVVLALTVVLAARTTDGSWVSFMESGAASDEPSARIEDDVTDGTPPSYVAKENEKAERIVAVANRRRIREQVLRYM